MHELSLMESVLTAVRDSAGQQNINRVSKLKLVVGKLSMALPDSLKFAFEVLKQEALFEHASLEIEETPILCHCDRCDLDFQLADSYHFVCPQCETGQVAIVSGRELYIDYYEGES